MGKRTHGEGTIYFHKGSGRWCAEATYWDGNRLRKKPVYGKTKKEVSEKLQKLREQLRQGVTPPPEKVTVGDYLEQWLEAHQSRLRPTTLRRYQQIVRHQILPELGRQRVSTLTPTTVEQWLQKLAQQNLAPRTLQQCRAVLRRALQDAVRDGLCVRNAAALARPIAVPPPTTSVWNAEEAQRFLVATYDHWLWPLFVVTLSLGLRQGEILGLSWEDVDLDVGLVVIRWQLQQIKGQWQRLPPKSQQSRRSLPLPPLAIQALERQRTQQHEWRETAGSAWPGNHWSLVFTTHTGAPIHPRTVSRVFHQLCLQADVPEIRFHDLRHSCATLLLAAGVDLKTVSTILGHSQISVTADFYGHVSTAMARPALERLNALLSH